MQTTTHPPPVSIKHFLHLMARHGRPLRTGSMPLIAMLILGEDKEQREAILRQTRGFFRQTCVLVPSGLESLPTSWLKALPGILWSLRKPHWDRLPFMISEVTNLDGVLLLRFAQEQPRDSSIHVSACDRVRIALNAALYPSRFRPLTRRHQHELRARWPNLELTQ